MSNKSKDDDVRDNLYRLKLRILRDQVLNESIDSSDAQSHDNSKDKIDSVIMIHERDRKIEKLNSDLEEAKKRHEKLKAKIKEEELKNHINHSISKVNSNLVNRQPDSVSKLLEMMVLQQTQIQSMITNQMIITNTQQISHVNHQSVPETNKTILLKESLEENKTISLVRISYPGNNAQKSLRRMGFAALFCSIIDNNFEDMTLSLTDKFLFEVKVKEIIATIEKYYTKPGGEISTLLNRLASDESPNFKILLTRSGTNDEMSLADRELNIGLENLVTKVTEIIPNFGTLGSQCKSILSEFLQNKQTFPDRYFFALELELLQIDGNNTIHNSGFLESQLLIIGVFLIRTLVMHELMRPVEYGLCSSISVIGKENFRILASLLVVLYISIISDFVAQRYPNNAKNRNNTAVTLAEMKGFLMSSDEIQPLLKKVQKTLDIARAKLLDWSKIYVHKLKPM